MITSDATDTLRGGFTLLIAIVVIGIVLAIGLSILTITLKEFLLSNTARESAFALAAADAGMECALYWDRSSEGGAFDIGPASRTIGCMDTSATFSGSVVSGTEQVFDFSWGSPAVCAKIVVTKYHNAAAPVVMGGGRTCPAGVVCTQVVSLGYNRACADIASPRTVERGLRTRY